MFCLFKFIIIKKQLCPNQNTQRISLLFLAKNNNQSLNKKSKNTTLDVCFVFAKKFTLVNEDGVVFDFQEAHCYTSNQKDATNSNANYE